MTINKTGFAELDWQPSTSTPGWDFVRLSGTLNRPFGGTTTTRCRSGAGIVHIPWISDELVEWVILSGVLRVNDIDLEAGDYASIPPRTETHMRSPNGMEGICVMHGAVLRAVHVWPLIKDLALSDANARRLLTIPWIDHLRRHVSAEHSDYLMSAIRQSPSEAVRELCLNLSRDVESEALIGIVNDTLNAPCRLSMRVSALMYLAARGRLDAEGWSSERAALLNPHGELIEVLKRHYAAADRAGLQRAIEERIASGRYTYNRPFYDLVLSQITEAQ